MTDWTEKDAARETGVSGKHVAGAWHQAREDARKSGEISSGSGGCFIATAVYGSYFCPEVVTLRGFRDKHLLVNPYGKVFVRIYYRFSPFLACLIRRFKILRTIIRQVLTPIVNFLEEK
ncbi:hypothetical protein COS59_01835 [Candidatus Wolfebacteria bacterium CG03_land_8_20_14_0_80_36_15]|uniref:Uncharacterized protein n=1 Tax=Candidatus Wolfebacteria bacterium CG03_land_8_20_14_0_80_36_15 TaxID=1975067 RepID=A0A2M7B7I6_9BACT|nr:MAG: hypothetical protein COS59_01835 [Candidatus Wolfebacteria bacterium CG03_land_8_20_14_0_80_36_15]